jgi:nucleoside-diphosphate-sugar epimerase
MSRNLKFYKNKNVLITGGASFIGSHLTELILQSGSNVRIIDDLSSGKKENLSSVINEINFYEGDVRNTDTLFPLLKNIDVVFNLAAMHGGRGYIETHPVECLNNMLLDHTLFEAAVRSNVESIVHASSACVYPTNLQDDEDDRYLLAESDANFEEPGKAFSDGEYGWAKLMGELQLKAFNKQYGVNGIAARIFTAYGERENESHAAIALIAKALLKIDPYPIWGNGQQTRNFTYVKDTVMGLAFAGTLNNGFDTLNIGSSNHYTIQDLCNIIFDYYDWKPNEFDFQLDKPVGVKSRASDNSKIKSFFNWEPTIGLKEGIEKTAKWYKENINNEKLDDLEKILMER